jgi:carbonic anhydrase
MASNGMAKILKGVLKYNKSVKGELLPIFREILDKPSPKSILVTCLDSRIVATRILQAEPGAYFLIRSPGNFIPKYECDDTSVPGGTAAAFELACVINKCNTIGVIGHSDSKILKLFYDMRNNLDDPANRNSQLKRWLLLNAKDSIEKFKDFEKSGFKKMLKFSTFNSEFNAYIDTENKLDPIDKFSQINALEQLKNANNYSFLKEKIAKNYIRAYALWVDVSNSDVYLFSYNEKRFVKIDENSYEKLYAECDTNFE